MSDENKKSDRPSDPLDPLAALGLTEDELTQIRYRAHIISQTMEQVLIKTLMWARDPELAVEALSRSFGKAAAAADVPPQVFQIFLRQAYEEYKDMRERLVVQTYAVASTPANSTVATRQVKKEEAPAPKTSPEKKEVN